MPDSIQMGIPGGNPGGGQNAVPTTGASATPAIGGQVNPLMSPFPAGAQAPGTSSTLSAASSSGAMDPTLAALMGMNPAGASATGPQGNIQGLSTDSIVKALHKTGIPSGDAYLIAQFLEGGAGFNPQAVKAMLDALKPQIERGQANVLEQFGSMGLRDSSPAAVGLGDYNSQVVLNEGQIISQMYEQSVQDYMQVLLGPVSGKKQSSGWGALIGGILDVAGVALAPFTGGLSLGLDAVGTGMMGGSGGGSSGGSGGSGGAPV